MSRSSSTSSSSGQESGRSLIEDHHLRRAQREEDIDKRRQAWLIQQEREREHELRKQKMILEYELKRAAMLSSNKECSTGRSSPQARNRSRTQDHRSKDPKVTIMSQKLESNDGSTPLFKGGSGIKISATDLRSIKINIHRNIPGTSVPHSEPQRDIINPEELTLKRRADEGIKPIFDREELKLLEFSRTPKEEEEHRIVQFVDIKKSEKNVHLQNRSSRSSSSPNSCDKNPKEDAQTHYFRHKPSYKGYHKEIHRRSKSNDRNKSSSSNRFLNEEARYRTNSSTRDSPPLHYSKKKNYPKCKSPRDQFHPDKGKRYRSDNYSSRSTDNDKFHRESRRRSTDRQDTKKSDSKITRGRRVSEIPHFIEPVPLPVYYGNFPQRPVIFGPMMQMHGPLIRSRLPFGPRAPLPHRFRNPNFYRPRLPSNRYFNPMF